MNKQEKIDYVLKNEQVTKISETDRFEYYIVKGVSNKIYEVLYMKYEEKYTCHCGNIRHTACYHIEAVKTLKGVSEALDFSQDAI